MVQRTTTYREQARVFLTHAHEELAKGDLQQASEKGWGAAALMVKEIARHRERPHWSHRHLHEVINALYQGDRRPGMVVPLQHLRALAFQLLRELVFGDGG